MSRWILLVVNNEFLDKADKFYHMRTLFFILGIVFFIITVVLFIRFDIKRNILMNVKHKQRSVPKSYSAKAPKVTAEKQNHKSEEATAKLSEETAVLGENYEETALLQDDTTAVLDESQLQFSIEKSIEMYSEQK